MKNKKGSDESLKEAVMMISVALVFNALDLVSGVIAAVKNRHLKSAKMRDGLFKKAGFLLVYFLAFLIDFEGVKVGFNIGVATLPIVVSFTCLTEVISIIENISKINSDLLPEKLLSLFHISKGE